MQLTTLSRQLFTAAALGGLWLALPAIAAAGKNSGTKFDPAADFSGYGTYDWVEETKRQPEDSPLALGGPADTAIRNSIDRQLAAQGFSPATGGEADFLVTYDGALIPVTDIEGLRHDIGGGVSWVMDGSIRSYQKGTLLIEVRDAGTGETVWSAWTEEKVRDPENPDQGRVDRIVKKLLKKFPPKR